jgi:hypothetical protein
MKKGIIPLLSALALALSPLVMANDIEPGKEEYRASPAANAIAVDGNLSEWTGVPVLSDPKFYSPKSSQGGAPYKLREPGDPGTLVLFEEWNGGTWTGPDDHTSAVQIVWDAENIYLGIVVTDDFHENAANSPWNGDSAQMLFSDGARSNTGEYYLYNYALGGTEDALGETIVEHERGPGGTEGVVTRNTTTKKTTYEIKIPAAALGLTGFTAGQQVGVGMAINDGDEATPGQKGWGGWGAHALVHSKHPSEAGLLTLQSPEPTVEILGVGTEALLGSDLTDPENDGDETVGATDPSWNWREVTSSVESFFDGAEGAFNVFDNVVGGGAAKWCCDDATEANPQWISVEFNNPVSLTHFTLTSGNDTPGRDPHVFQIQGSNDGQNFTPIYVRDSDVSLWTARDQVIKITLALPAPPYRHIRYYVTQTPEPLHQLNEIEYFGTIGGADLMFLSSINPILNRFSFRATDVGSSIVNAASATLTIDGQNVTLTSAKSGDATDFTHTPAAPFPPGSSHTYSIEVRDTLGNLVTSTGNFTIPAYALLSPAEKVTPDTSKPGFIWNVHQNEAFTAVDNTRPVLQLAGLLGENYADPLVQGPAIAPGTPGANNRLPIMFEIETVINLDQFAGGLGEIQPDDQMPGIPGTSANASTEGIAAEIITYLELSAGRHTIIVNSDDGFRTTAGNVRDVFSAQLAGEFVGGRGAADTVYTVYAQEAGVYPFRTIWYVGGGGANIEWKSELADGTRVLLNDVPSGGIRAYRAASGLPTGISEVVPVRNSTGVAGDSSIRAVITEGASAVDLASVRLSLNGSPLTAAATRAGNLITIEHQPSTLFPPLSTNSATISYTAAGVTRTETWQFVVANYGYLTADLRVTPNTAMPGFIWNVHQNEAFTAVDNTRPALQLAGLLGENFADPLVQGPAIAAGTPGANNNLPVRFEIETVINLDQLGGANGEFQPDDQMPGVPGTSVNVSTEGIAAEIITYLELPAGRTTLIVNSDDGFRTTGGNIRDIVASQFLGEFVGGRGAADTVYSFFVEQAGVYPLRTVWYEGGGGANIEWKLQKADGTRVLLNDVAAGGPRAYRAVTAGISSPAIVRLTPGQNDLRTIATTPIEVTIEEGATPIENSSVQLFIDGASVTPVVTRAGNVVTIRHQPASPLAAGATHAARVRYTYGGTERIAEWSFTVPPTTLDNLHGYPGLILGAAANTPDAGGRTGLAGDYAIDLGRAGAVTPSVLIPDGTFVNATTADDVMTFSIWIKKYDNAKSSAFWADSPSSPSGMRGFQAHTPWSDNNVYFDTAGCCVLDETRISLAIADFPGFTDATWWTDQWHHWVFVKDTSAKRIYIDGQLFHEGGGFTPLPTDFARIWLGAEGGGNEGRANNMHGLIDDFAVFGTALTAAQVSQLAAGTLPSALPATAKPLAYWDFNDVTVSEEAPEVAISRAGNDITITWINGGTLQSSPAVAGVGANWQNLESDGSYTTTAAGAAMFFRVVR